MKRFWLDDMWPWSKSWTMTSRKMSRANLTFVILMLIQLVPSFCIVDKKCTEGELNQCDTNEICQITQKGQDGVCKCRDGFIQNPVTNRCETPPEPSSSHLALGLGLGLTFFLLAVLITLTALHYKFGLLSGMCDGLPHIRQFWSSGRDFNMVDNEDDDVNPIV